MNHLKTVELLFLVKYANRYPNDANILTKCPYEQDVGMQMTIPTE